MVRQSNLTDCASTANRTFPLPARIPNTPLQTDSEPGKDPGFSKRKEGKSSLSMNSQRHTQPAGV